MEFELLGEHFPDAIVIGVKTVDGSVLLKPSMSRKMEPDEEIIVIAEDDDKYNFIPLASCDVAEAPAMAVPMKKAEKILICGWRRDARDVLNLIDELVLPGSEIHILCHLEVEARETMLEDSGFDVHALMNTRLMHHVGFARRHFEKVTVDTCTCCSSASLSSI